MTRLQFATCAFTALVLGGPLGCATVDHARAEEHERRAHRAADRGHFGQAVREDQKADRLEDKARRDPLP